MGMETMKGRRSRGVSFRFFLVAIAWLLVHTVHLFTIPHGRISPSRPGWKDSRGPQVTRWHPGRGGVASRASPQQDSDAEDNNAEDQLDLEEAIAEAERVLQDNDTVEKIKAVLRKAQKINPGKWTLSGKKDELKQKLREFVEEATLKGLKEDSHRAQVTSWHPGRGGVASRASPQQDSGAEDWLAKSREEVEGFKKAQVPSWAEAVLIDGGLEADDEFIQRTVTALQQQGVTGKSLLELTLEELMAAPYNIPGGPAKLLAEKIRLLQEPQALPSASSATSWVQEAVEVKFDVFMQNSNFSMLKNWRTYKRTLPVREVNQKPLPLFELLYFGNDADVQTLGSLLAKVPGTTSRFVAPYLTAPGAYGKTSSVLPAFLTNDDLGLYVYMSFSNNAERRHEGPSVGMIETMHSQKTNPDLAGVAFICECLKTQLEEGKYVRPDPLPEWFTSITDGTADHIDKLRDQIKKLLQEIRPQQKLVLIHLDEHKKMWEGKDARAIQFRRAAVQALLAVDFVRVILTFTEPPSLPADAARNTSALARVALPFARAAADKVALHFCPDILNMYGTPMDWTAAEQRVWACCLLWVGLCIDVESPTALHQPDSQLRKGFSSLTKWLRSKGAKISKTQFLARFGETFNKVRDWDKDKSPLDTKVVRQLAAGIPDADTPQNEAFPTLVSVAGQRLCLPLFRLLYVRPLNQSELSSCFWRSRDVFLEDMRKAPTQVLVGSPLERAVLCALTCREYLPLPGLPDIPVSFEQLEPGRLFEKVSATGSEVQLARALESLNSNTLYYDGHDGTEGHPLADIWFCADPRWLVLLDCGGTKKKAKKKMSAKQAQIRQLVKDGCLSDWKVTVLIFIPAAPSETIASSTPSPNVDIAIIAGSLAAEWLGSLSQLLQYLPEDG
ncbi:unnamed protein product [Effrenium voratum]|nr:unnamed protein product [Effrenium voratum]